MLASHAKHPRFDLDCPHNWWPSPVTLLGGQGYWDGDGTVTQVFIIF